MDTWKFFDITHKEHVLCNPTTIEKYDELVSLLRLAEGDRVVEIAMGKGEFIVRLAEAYTVTGVGVDLSPYCVSDAKEKLRQRAPDAGLEFIEMDGADYRPEQPESFDLAACIGAGWVYGGHRGTLEALTRMVKPGGWVIAGEPFWRQEPPPEYLEATGFEADSFGRHHENAQAGEEFGLELTYTIVSSQDDWDRYEGLQWYSAEEWARQNPDDPDVGELLERVRGSKDAYLHWGRDLLGWAIYVYRKG